MMENTRSTFYESHKTQENSTFFPDLLIENHITFAFPLLLWLVMFSLLSTVAEILKGCIDESTVSSKGVSSMVKLLLVTVTE